MEAHKDVPWMTDGLPDVAAIVDAAIEKTLLKESNKRGDPRPQTNAWASGWHPCPRQIFLGMTRPETRPPFGPQTLYRFRRGNQRERDFLADLDMYGRESDPPFETMQRQQRIKITGFGGRVLITGALDVKLKIKGTAGQAFVFPIEVKSWHPGLAERIHTVEDLDRSRYTRGAEMQLLSYLYGENLPVGYLALDLPGWPRFIRVSLEERWDKIAAFVANVETAVKAVDAGGDPPPFIENKAECLTCPFYGRACNPPIKSGAGVSVMTDTDLTEAVRRAHETKAARDEYEASWGKVKEALRASGVSGAILGDFLVKVSNVEKRFKAAPAKEAFSRTDKHFELIPLDPNGPAV